MSVRKNNAELVGFVKAFQSKYGVNVNVEHCPRRVGGGMFSPAGTYLTITGPNVYCRIYASTMAAVYAEAEKLIADKGW